MSATAIAAFFPSVISKSVFAPRRADKSLEANSTPAGLIYAGVAALQGAKICEGISAIANEGKAVAEGIAKTEHTLQGLNSTNSIFNDLKAAGKACVKHANINGLIGLGALVNALYDENPCSALVQNGTMFGAMLLGEGAHKLICGESKSIREDGVNKIDVKEGLYRKNDTVRDAVDKFVEHCNTRENAWKECGEVKKALGKAMKYVPSGLKGLSFAAASIGASALGYFAGGKVANAVIEEKPNSNKTAKIVDMNAQQKAKEVNLNSVYSPAV